MANQSQTQTKGMGCGMRLIAFIVIIAILIAIFSWPVAPGVSTLEYLIYLLNLMGFTLPQIKITAILIPLLFRAAHSGLIVAVVYFSSITLMRLIQWPILFWLDQRMIGKIERDLSVARQTSWVSRFMARVAPGEDPGEAEELHGGVYETKPGEVFLDLFFPDWWWMLWTLIKSHSRFILASWLIVSISSMLYGWLLLIPAIVLMFASVMVSVRYISWEWLRSNTIWFVFSNTYILLKAQGTVPGLIAGAGVDVKKNETDSTVPKEPVMAVKPSDLPTRLVGYISIPFYDEWVLEILGRFRGLRTIVVTSFFVGAEDVLGFFPRASRIQQTMNRAVQLRADTAPYLHMVGSKAAAILLPPDDPNTPWSRAEAERKVSDYIRRATAHLPAPRLINLLVLKWEKLGRRIETNTLPSSVTPPSGPTPSAAAEEFHVRREESEEGGKPTQANQTKNRTGSPHKLSRRRS